MVGIQTRREGFAISHGSGLWGFDIALRMLTIQICSELHILRPLSVPHM